MEILAILVVIIYCFFEMAATFVIGAVAAAATFLAIIKLLELILPEELPGVVQVFILLILFAACGSAGVFAMKAAASVFAW